MLGSSAVRSLRTAAIAPRAARRKQESVVPWRRAVSTAALQTVSSLPNGVRVATEETPGHFCSIGIYVDAGSRYESVVDRGSSHLLDRLAWKVSRKTSVISSFLSDFLYIEHLEQDL
jgi:processing peptidase subunit alpha